MIEVASNLIVIFLLWVFIDAFTRSKENAKKKYTFVEWLTLQDIDDQKPINVKANVSYKKTKKKQKVNQKQKKEAEAKKEDVDTEILEDCKSAMKYLGVDSRQQKYLINKFLEKNMEIVSVEDFIEKTFK